MKLFGSTISKKVLIAAAAVLAVVLVFAVLSLYANTAKGILANVSVFGVDLGGMSREEAVQAINEKCEKQFKDAKITIKLEDIYTCDVTADELGVKIPAEKLADKAMKIGREGGFFKRTFSVIGLIFGGKEVGEEVEFDAAAVENLSFGFTEHDIAPVDATYTIEGETLLLHPRTDGKKTNLDALFDELKVRFAKKDFSDLEIKREVAESVALDLDKVYSEVHKEVSDARLEKVDGKNKVIPHVVGVDFDLETAKSAYDENSKEVIKIPLKLTQPKVQMKHLEIDLYKHCLSRVETYFSPKKVSRTANVRLAAKLVNGTLLNPGEEFSYNKVVGPRTKERGFQLAGIYSGGKEVDGIGGGICQVSSTLYMAALRANFKITERTNHAFYVDYAPKGEDATVVYGSLDFRFVNTSEYPVKIVATSKNNYIRIEIMGTEPDEKRTVELTKKTHSQTAYTTKEEEDPNLPAGTREVEQKGQQGLTMSVYRNVYDENGKLVESYLENRSRYNAKPEIVRVGTGPAVPAVTPEVPATPAEPTVPVSPEKPSEPVTPPSTEQPVVPEDSGVTAEPEVPVSPETPEASEETNDAATATE